MSVDLFGFAVAILLAAANVSRHGTTTTVVRPKPARGVSGWIDAHGIKRAKTVVVYKRVSKDWLTQEGSPRETCWSPGTRVDHPAWDPKSSECGEGKYHAVARPYFADEFRDAQGDRYVAIEVATRDLYAWDGGQYPHKIAFRRGVVMHEVDRYGERIGGES